LGLLTYERLAGGRPPMDGALPSVTTVGAVVPVAVDSVIAQATATDPAERHATAEAFLAAFGRACGAIAPAPVYTAVDNPYKGLHAFGEADQEDFYGRESLVSELAADVAEHRLVAVVGPSGIGKSSVVRAGLIPA